MARAHPEVVFVPGVGGPDDTSPELLDALRQTGATVYELPSVAPRGHIDDLAAEAAEQINELDVLPDATLLGHSLGGRIALQEATRREYGRLVLCSPTADMSYFLKNQEAQERLARMTEEQLQLLRSLALNGLGRIVRVPRGQRHVLVGGKEIAFGAMYSFAEDLAQQLGTTPHLIPQAPHSIEAPEYLNEAVRITTAP